MTTRPSAAPLFELDAVHKVYGTGGEAVHALRGIDWILSPGEFTGLVGPSGSGKTTLLNLLGCLDRPTSGSVKLDGRELFSRSERQLSRLRAERLGFIFQDFNLFAVLSAYENVEYPLLLNGIPAMERHRRVDAMLERVGLRPKRSRRPDELSGGEKQRVAIARALVHRPALVLADEPTANLDSETGSRIVSLLAELNRELGTTFVIGTHDPALAPHLRRVTTLRDGRITEDRAGSGA